MLGATDVVPFVPLDETTPREARAAQVRFAGWMSEALEVPCFLYGPRVSLPEVRRRPAGRDPLVPHVPIRFRAA